jgi:ABC-2 type transport system ATP-binding protein
MITVTDLTRNYGDLVAVNNISFSIRKGEIAGLLGPNGAGKTTTLRMLTCYLKPTQGMITVGDYLVEENPLAVKKLIGYLPEEAPIYSDMIVYDYLRYIGMIRGIPEEELRDRIKRIADICDINEVMHQMVSELSKGYKQRVGLAHAMIHDPEIIILDEPTSGLDPNQIVEIRNLIKKIGKEKTVILSTHILSEVEATCNRVIIIDRGSIVADGSTEALRSSGGKGMWISLTVGGVAFDELSAALRDVPGVESVAEKRSDQNLTTAMVVPTGDEVRPAIGKCVCEKGWQLYEMKQEIRTLETIFRELTRGGGNEI